MNTDLNSTNQEKNKVKKRLIMALTVTSAIFFVLSSLVLSPLYVYACSDVVYAVTVLPEILEIIIDIVDVAAYAVSFSIIIYSIFKFSFKRSLVLISIYCVTVFLKYLANLIITSVSDGAFSLDDTVYVILYFALDLILLGIILLVTFAFMRKYFERRSIIEKANATLGRKTPSVHSELFEVKKFFSAANPLQCSALATGIILSVSKIFTRILFDIYIGLPSSLADAMWMIAYYVSDILITLIVYAISLYIFAHFEAKEQV